MTFLDVYPVVLRRCRLIRATPEEKEELTAEAVCVALAGFRSLERRGKTVSPKSIAYYAIRRACSGRKVATSDSKRDAMRKVTHDVENLPENLIHCLASGESPADEAIVRIDFPAFLKTVGSKKRRACGMFLSGQTTPEVSRRIRISPGRVSQIRRELVEGYHAFTV